LIYKFYKIEHMTDNEVKVDLMNHQLAEGEVAQRIKQQGKLDIGAMRPYVHKGGSFISVYSGTGDRTKPENYVAIPVTNATLRREEWIHLDEAVIGVSRQPLTGISDLEAAGLVYNLGNAMGTTVLESHEVSDAFEAELSMDGITRTKGDRPTYGSVYLPIPITHVDFVINSRVLEASRNLGNPLDTTSVERATRKIREKLERMLFNNTPYKFGGGTIYGVTNHPDRNTISLAKNWDAADKTGKDILDDVVAMKKAAFDAGYFGPFNLYYPTGYETVLDKDYDATKGSTIRERILKIAGISSVKVASKLPEHNVSLIQMTSDVIRLVKGMPIKNVQWSTEGTMVNNFKVMTIQVPQLRSDAMNRTGIVHLA
jgi:uncharacterized linocin/CFP29 family protein